MTLPLPRVLPTDGMDDPGREIDLLFNEHADEIEAAAAAASAATAHGAASAPHAGHATPASVSAQIAAESGVAVTPPTVGKVYALTDQECTLYWPALINGFERLGFRPAVAVSGSQIIRNGLRINHSAAASAALTVTVSDKPTQAQVCTLSSSVSVLDTASLAGATLRVLPIGDSLTSQASLVSRMATLATAAGFTVTGLGTQGSAPNSHEGRPGWSWAAFNGASSPLFSSGALNWGNYLSTIGANPHVIAWLLGTNSVLTAIDGLSLTAAVAAAVAAAATDVAHAQTLITAAQAALATASHLVLLPPTGTYDASGYGANYGNDRPQHLYHAAMLAYRAALATAFAGQEASGIFVAELGALIDPQYSGQISAVAVSAYNSTTVNEATNGVHYSSSGYAELAAAYLPAVSAAFLAIPVPVFRVITFAQTAAPYVRTWEYDSGLLTEYDGATWDTSSAPGAYQSDARGGLAVPANTATASGQLSAGNWVVDASGNRPSTGTVLCVAVHPNGLSVAYGLQASPWLRIHKRASVGGAWSNLDLSSMSPPTDRVYGLAWSNDGTRLAVGKYGGSSFAIYSWGADTLSNRVTPAAQPTGTSTSIAWRGDDSALVLGNLSSPYLDAYTRSGDVYTKVSNPATLPAGNARHAAWSPDGTKVAVAVQHATSLIWYDWSGSALTLRTNPVSLPSGFASGIGWIDDNHLCVGHAGTSGAAYLATYTISGGLLVADSAPVPLSALGGTVTTIRAF